MDRHAIRKHNTLTVLRAVRDLEPISKTELSNLTGLTVATISSIISDLGKIGLIGETKDMRSTGGRKAVLVELNGSDAVVVSVVIDRHGVRTALLTLGGELFHMHYGQFQEDRTEEVVFAEVERLIKEALSHVTDQLVLGIGITSDGLIDSDEGLWLRPQDFQFRNISVRNRLANKFNMPVLFAQSGQGMAVGEYLFGAGVGCTSFVHVHIGETIRTGIILNGRLFTGFNFGAGNVAHVRVSSRNIPCTCGSTGCFEAMATHSGIVTRFIQRMEDRDISKLFEMVNYDLSGLSADMVYTNAIQRDPIARQVIRDTGRYIGRGLGAIANLINPEKIFISGIYNAHSIMNREINKFLAHSAVSNNLNRVYVGETGIAEAPGTIGAGALVIQALYEGHLELDSLTTRKMEAE